jgi:hypothetical protein
MVSEHLYNSRYIGFHSKVVRHIEDKLESSAIYSHRHGGFS